MIEIADKFNMVDMGGIDVVESQGETVSGLYTKLLNSIQKCRYTVLYNWSFAGIQITPTPTEITIGDNTVVINDAISVTSDDVVHIHSIEVPVYPELEELNVIENGEYVPSEGIYGFSRANVQVPSPELETLTVTSNGEYVPSEGIYGFSRVTVNTPAANPNIVPFDIAGETYLDVSSGTLRWKTTTAYHIFAVVLDPGSYLFARDVNASFTTARYNSDTLMNRMDELIEKSLSPAPEITNLFSLTFVGNFSGSYNAFTVASKTGVLFNNDSSNVINPIIYKIY